MSDTLSILNTFNTKKSIGGITIDAFTSESYEFNARATRYPVEEGADITDHVIKDPDSISITGIIGAVTSSGEGSSTNRVIDVFNSLKDMFDNSDIVTVVAGLKVYENMYIKSYNIPRNVNNGMSLEFNIVFDNIRTVSSRVTDIPNNQLGGDADTDKLQAQSQADVGTTTSGQTQQENTWYDDAVAWVDDNLSFLNE